MTAWLSFALGAGVRTNTTADQRGELYRRRSQLDDIAADIETLGRGGYSTWETISTLGDQVYDPTLQRWVRAPKPKKPSSGPPRSGGASEIAARARSLRKRMGA